MLNPPLLMEMASAYLSLGPSEPRGASAVLSPLLPKAAAVRWGSASYGCSRSFSSSPGPFPSALSCSNRPLLSLPALACFQCPSFLAAALSSPQALELVVRRVPGLLEAQILLARTRYLSGQHDAAARALKAALDLQPNKAEALLLQAQLHLARGNPRMAVDFLEQAVSANFAIRETPGFSQAKAQALLATDEVTAAVKRAPAPLLS